MASCREVTHGMEAQPVPRPPAPSSWARGINGDTAAKIAVKRGLGLRHFYMYDIKIPSPDKLISAFYSLILSKILALVQERAVFYNWWLYKPTEGYSIIGTPTYYLHPTLEIKTAFLKLP